MTNVWLYSADGRALYWVRVPLPMPLAVTYSGMVYYWVAPHNRYELSRVQPAVLEDPGDPVSVSASLDPEESPEETVS